jgi:hypothetical protein
MEWLFSWEVTSVLVSVMVGIAFAVLAMNDFKIAKTLFLLAAGDANGGAIMWGTKSALPLWSLALIVFLLCGGIGVLTLLAFRYVDSKKADSGNSPEHPAETAIPSVPPVAIFADCQIVSLPIVIPPQTSLYLVALNEKRMRSKGAANWGLYEVPNRGDKPMQWPSKERMREKVPPGTFPNPFAYKCDFSNHSQVNVLDVSVEMRIWFGNKGGEENAVRFTPILSPLDAGSHFVFYVVNDCPSQASAIMPDKIGVRVIGEAARREVLLSRPNRNPIESIMSFFPTPKQWIGEMPCQ